jgi:small subunit ribosomal protein S2
MTSVSLRELLEAGVHFGHQAKRWNPKMQPYIFGEKSGIHIIDLQQTASSLNRACAYVSQTVSKGGKVLFIGTKRQAQEIIRQESERVGMFHVTNRWLGGTLTNFVTIKQSIERLTYLEQARDDGKFSFLTKKEALSYEREIAKLKKSLGGIQEMKKLPEVVFIVDPRKEKIAIAEARKLKIPVVAVADTNCDPEGITYVIPGNDDALKAIRLFASKIADACGDGSNMAKDYTKAAYGAATAGGDSEEVATVPAGGNMPEVVRKGEAAETAPAEEKKAEPAEAGAEVSDQSDQAAPEPMAAPTAPEPMAAPTAPEPMAAPPEPMAAPPETKTEKKADDAE